MEQNLWEPVRTQLTQEPEQTALTCSAQQQAPKDSLSKWTKWCFTFINGWLLAALFNAVFIAALFYFSHYCINVPAPLFLCVVSNIFELWSSAHMSMRHFTSSLHPINSQLILLSPLSWRCLTPQSVRQWRKAKRKPFGGERFWTQNNPMEI